MIQLSVNQVGNYYRQNLLSTPIRKRKLCKTHKITRVCLPNKKKVCRKRNKRYDVKAISKTSQISSSNNNNKKRIRRKTACAPFQAVVVGYTREKHNILPK